MNTNPWNRAIPRQAPAGSGLDWPVNRAFRSPTPMARYNFRSPRLHVDQPLQAGAAVTLEKPQGHYLTHVLRLQPDDPVLLFNGRDGEWRGRPPVAGKRALTVRLGAHTPPPDTAHRPPQVVLTSQT